MGLGVRLSLTKKYSCYSVELFSHHIKMEATTQSKPNSHGWSVKRPLVQGGDQVSLSRAGAFKNSGNEEGREWRTPALLVPTVGGLVPHLTTDIWEEFEQVFTTVRYDDVRPFESAKSDVHWCLNQDPTKVFIVITIRDTTTAKPNRTLVTDEAKLKSMCEVVDQQFRPNLWACPQDAVPETTGSNKNSLAVERTGTWAMLSESGNRLACIVGRDSLSAKASAKKATAALKGQGGYLIDAAKVEVARDIISDLDVTLPRAVIAGAAGPSEILELIAAGYDLVESSYPQYLAKVGYASSFWIDDDMSNEWEFHTKFDARSPVFLVDTRPLVSSCKCFACLNHTRAYIRHLTETREMLGETLLYAHNLTMMLKLVDVARSKILSGEFKAWHEKWLFRCSDGNI